MLVKRRVLKNVGAKVTNDFSINVPIPFLNWFKILGVVHVSSLK